MKPLITPDELLQKFPSNPYVFFARSIAQDILYRKDPRLAVLVGPCSIHDPQSALDFAERLKKLSFKIKNTLFPIMRFFVEKPRTRIGWKGILYDPYLNNSNNLEMGLTLCRKLLSQMAKLQIPCCMEFLDPLVSFYLRDLITWGIVGARTVASQPHRQMASGLTFPVGFKNDIHGNLEIAVDAIVASSQSHCHIGVNNQGKIATSNTNGNPLSHLVLRGAQEKSNYDPISIKNSVCLLQKYGLNPSLLIDCSHGNSGKDPQRQKIPFLSAIEQSIQGTSAIAGVMIESHIFGGKQSLSNNLLYGVSLTDACLSWEETESLLLFADEALSSRSISIHSTQN